VNDREKNTGNAVHVKEPKNPSFKEYESISKEKLIDALVLAKINEAHLKKNTQ